MYIVIKDCNGKKQKIVLSEELLEFFCEEQKREEKERYEKRKHIDFHSLDDYIVLMKAITETLEETFFRQERISAILDIVSTCTPTQQKRFYLHFFCGYTYKRIAEIENCGVSKIQKSVEKVLKKIKSSMKD